MTNGIIIFFYLSMCLDVERLIKKITIILMSSNVRLLAKLCQLHNNIFFVNFVIDDYRLMS